MEHAAEFLLSENLFTRYRLRNRFYQQLFFGLVGKINAQYGEQPEQYRVMQEGNAYLDAHFPGLSSVMAMRLPESETELQTEPEPEQ